MTYKFKNRYYKNRKSHCFTMNEFAIEGKLSITHLLNTNVLDYEIQPQQVRSSTNSNYLKGLFNPVPLTSDDFKFINANGVYHYLEGFSDSEEEWGIDKPLFKNLLKEFKKSTENTLDGCFLISKDWFDKESKKVRSREFTLYDYYILIIWVDKNDTSKLYISEWYSD